MRCQPTYHPTPNQLIIDDSLPERNVSLTLPQEPCPRQNDSRTPYLSFRDRDDISSRCAPCYFVVVFGVKKRAFYVATWPTRDQKASLLPMQT